ncbi:MAG: ABC transporter permease subunit [Candidatus Nanopelagicales bacterium]
MLTTVFSKTVLDRWRGVTITVVSLSLLLYFAMGVYRDLDLAIYTGLPASFKSLIGIPENADVGSLAYSAVYNSYGALAFSGLAIAMGAAFIAGEERKGTIGELLANPKSRTHIVVSKAGAMLLLLGLGGLLLWAAAVISPALLDVSIAGLHVGAFTLHLTVSTFFYGFLALAIGAWTGRTGMAIGIPAAVMVLSFFAVGLLPLVSGWEDVAKFFPWYYLGGSEPLLNGVDWAHVAILVGGSAVLFVLALVGVNRRDLRGRSTGVSLIDRARSNPMTAKLAERMAGSTRVSRIWVKSASEHQGLLLVVSAAMFFIMGVLMGPVYTAMDQTLVSMGDALPEALLALFGGGNTSTPEGFYQIENFGLMAPISIMVVTVTLGAKALAGEESDRTMGLLLAQPVSRSKVLAEKAFAMVLFGVIVGVVTFAGVLAGNALGDMGIDIGNIAATCVLLTLIGLLFGALALLTSAATGRLAAAVWVPVAAALVAHVANAMASLQDAAWGRLSPFHYYLGSDPLSNGMSWVDAAVLAAATVVILALAFPAFARRDLREQG